MPLSGCTPHLTVIVRVAKPSSHLLLNGSSFPQVTFHGLELSKFWINSIILVRICPVRHSGSNLNTTKGSGELWRSFHWVEKTRFLASTRIKKSSAWFLVLNGYLHPSKAQLLQSWVWRLCNSCSSKHPKPFDSLPVGAECNQPKHSVLRGCRQWGLVMPQGSGVGLSPCELSPHSHHITSQILNISYETSLELMRLSCNIQFTSLQLLRGAR